MLKNKSDKSFFFGLVLLACFNQDGFASRDSLRSQGTFSRAIQDSNDHIDKTIRSSTEIVGSIRPAWLAWKREMKSQYPDSVLAGKGHINFSIAPDGSVIQASFGGVYKLDSSIQKKALEFMRGIKFREISQARIDSAYFPINFNSR